jgi:hypothetical protein
LLKKGVLRAGLHKVVDSDLDFHILIIGAIHLASVPDLEEREPETKSEKTRKCQGKKKHVADTIGNRVWYIL